MVICQCSNLGDAVAADATFRRTQELHADIANLETDLLAGLAISPWFTYRREEAIPHYRARIAAGRDIDPPEDWTQSDTINHLNRSAFEVRPLEARRATTLK